MNKQKIVAKLNSEYMLKRKKAVFFAEQNKQTALENKDYLNLDIKERNLVLDISKLKFENKPAGKLQKQLKEVIRQKQQVLNNLGLTLNQLQPNYECIKCSDTGKINGKYCTCFKQAMNNLLMKDSQINLTNLPNLKDYNVDVFKNNKEQIKKVLTICKKFVSSFETSKVKTLIFSGGTGVGKTYLSKTIAKELLKKGNTAYYTTAFNLNNDMLKCHTTFDENKFDILSNVIDSDLLVIDDLGTEPILKNVTIEYLQLIINERLEKNKGTIINTNLGPQHIINRYGERIFSRLMNKQTSLPVNIDGVDLRLKKQINN